MNRSGHWRSRLTGTMLGHLQLATFTAVMLGFTGATSTGQLLSERSRLRVSEAELLAASASLANRLESQDGQVDQSEPLIVQELQDHSSMRANLWIEQPDGHVITPRRAHRPIPADLLKAAVTANPLRKQGQLNLIVLQEREHLTLLERRLQSGDLLWSSTEISCLGSAQSEFLAWMNLDLGQLPQRLVAAGQLAGGAHTKPLQELSSRSVELTAEGLQTAALTVPKGPQKLSQLTRTYNALTERLAQS
ncbi:hypothetical protein [Synechococcus sp. GEYO]|uniref:hypothetical protein n=1 Tax=Synechococcus sp. GEYO TaxID=2575511 RepID=UPI0010BD7C4F|nr:hypothetical protein [Synechococcus sp. GEYO]